MWISRTRLPHLLAPSAYHDPAHHERELARVFRPGWHFVASLDELPPGHTLRRPVLGATVRVQRTGEGLAAWASPAVAPRPGRERPCRLASVGTLVFVSLDDDAPGLRAHLGERTWTLAERLFSPSRRLAVRRELAHPCNWKIPLENVLESYHVPCLHDNVIARHPRLLKVFGGRPPSASDVVHELGDRFTVYRDSIGADSALYRAFLALFEPGASTGYVHHHACPNVILAHTSIVSFLQVVEPLSPTTSRSSIRLFLSPGPRPLAPLLAPALRASAAALIDMVLREDAAVYPDVQRGLEASPHAGVLGSREERIHAFHTYLLEAGAGE